MSERFVKLDSVTFFAFFTAHGFERLPKTRNSGEEVVFIRRHNHNRNLMVKVYSSVKDGAGEARACGADAIRIVAIFDNGQRSFGVGKFPRIYRTAPPDMEDDERQVHVQKRVLDRMREAYARCNEWLKQQANHERR